MHDDTRPNIVMVDCHDLGQHLNCYGWETVVSPNIDQLAADGLLFENNFCTAPQCSPSRAALYTGRYPHSNGVMGLAHGNFKWRLNDDEVYLAHHLQAAGYETALFGIQHVTTYTDAEMARLGFDQFDRRPHAKTETGPAARDFLLHADRHKRPFFLNVGFVEPHRLGPQSTFNVDDPETSLGVQVPPYLPDIPEAREEFSELQGMIRDMDQGFGMIYHALLQNDLLENTLVIFTADHGLAMPRAKCTCYDPGLETALIIRWPGGGLTGGQRYQEMISNVDLLPTILELLDLPLPANLQGRSFAPLLRGEAYTPRDVIFAEKTFHTAYEPMRAIRSETHKLILNMEADVAVNLPSDIKRSKIAPAMIDYVTTHRPHVELYDLVNDPLEQDNLAGQEEVAAIEKALMAQLLAWMQDTEDPLLDGPVPSPYYRDAVQLLHGAS